MGNGWAAQIALYKLSVNGQAVFIWQSSVS